MSVIVSLKAKSCIRRKVRGQGETEIPIQYTIYKDCVQMLLNMFKC